MDNKELTHDEMRFLRRETIQYHLWILTGEYGWNWSENLHNLKLVVRLYELQFYGQELKLS